MLQARRNGAALLAPARGTTVEFLPQRVPLSSLDVIACDKMCHAVEKCCRGCTGGYPELALDYMAKKGIVSARCMYVDCLAGWPPSIGMVRALVCCTIPTRATGCYHHASKEDMRTWGVNLTCVCVFRLCKTDPAFSLGGAKQWESAQFGASRRRCECVLPFAS